jgi:hypothetical protein
MQVVDRTEGKGPPQPAAPDTETLPGAHKATIGGEVPVQEDESGSTVDAVIDIVPTERVETAYGGIFYLLNAALAMGLYGDFTAPRGTNLELSPWDWLALVGRKWFGDEFVSDPVWKVLADLAVRPPEDEPGRDFDMPEGWLEQHLHVLSARLVLALDPGDASEVPALVCRHRARIEIAPSCVHVHLSLCDLPLSIRFAGLDRDPGWIPAAGRFIAFHFE